MGLIVLRSRLMFLQRVVVAVVSLMLSPGCTHTLHTYRDGGPGAEVYNLETSWVVP